MNLMYSIPSPLARDLQLLTLQLLQHLHLEAKESPPTRHPYSAIVSRCCSLRLPPATAIVNLWVGEASYRYSRQMA